MVKFKYTIFYVQDVTRTIEFYENSFGLKRIFIAPDNSYGELLTGETTLSFASVDLAKSNLKNGFLESGTGQKPFGMEIGFTTENVEETVKSAINAGAMLIEEAKVKPWGQTVAYVTDPDGFLVEICTPMN